MAKATIASKSKNYFKKKANQEGKIKIIMTHCGLKPKNRGVITTRDG